MKLAKQHFPDSDLANSTWTAPGVNVALEIKNRNVDAGPLNQLVPKLKDYCQNKRSIPELKLALQKQKVLRNRARRRSYHRPCRSSWEWSPCLLTWNTS